MTHATNLGDQEVDAPVLKVAHADAEEAAHVAGGVEADRERVAGGHALGQQHPHVTPAVVVQR